MDCIMDLPPVGNEMWEWYQNLIQIRKKWVSNSLITPANLSVHCEKDRHLFCLQYQNENDEVFIVSRLGGGEQVESVPCEAVSILLDSRVQNASDLSGLSSLELDANQAVVGHGRLIWDD